MGLPINKGPDFTPSQWMAAAIGAFALAGISHVLSLSRSWSVVLIAVGFCLPPAIIGWLNSKNRRLS